LTAPEYQRTNFTHAELVDVVTRRLVRPWNSLCAVLAVLLAGVDPATPLPTSTAGRQAAATVAERIGSCYELDGYSPARAAEAIAQHLDRLRARAEAAVGEAAEGEAAEGEAVEGEAVEGEAVEGEAVEGEAVAGRTAVSTGDLLLEIRTLLSYAAPILMDVAEQAEATGVDTRPNTGQDPEISAFTLPTLPEIAGSAAAELVRPVAASAAARP
jgi:methionyl-tRNA synthetase